MNIPGVVVVPRFLTPTVCKKLIQIYDRRHDLSTNKDYSGNWVVWLFDLRDKFPDEYEFMCAQVTKARDAVRFKMGIESPLLIEAAFLAMLPPGGHHPRHCDNCKMDGSPNHTPQRDYSAIVYLNSEFEGGPLIFPSRGTLIPAPGTLVAFPSNRDFPHEVPPVTKGKRYSMPIWFTLKPQFNMFGSHR